MSDEISKKKAERPETGHAKLYIDWRFIENLLDLPEGVRVAGIYDYPPIGGVVVHLIGDSLPRVPPYRDIPVVETRWHDMKLPNGERSYRIVTGIEVIIPEEK